MLKSTGCTTNQMYCARDVETQVHICVFLFIVLIGVAFFVFVSLHLSKLQKKQIAKKSLHKKNARRLPPIQIMEQTIVDGMNLNINALDHMEAGSHVQKFPARPAEGDSSSLRRGRLNYVVYEKAEFLLDCRYQLQEILGKGSYGTVVSVIDLKSKDKTPLLVKKVFNIFNKEVLLKRAIRELKLMRFFKGHKNIINLVDLDIVYTRPYDGLYCFQELVDYDLAKVIHSQVQFSKYHIQCFVYQILCGLKYIHSLEVIHRDLKPGNILISMQGNLKICDFGLARGISPKFITKLNSKSNHITNYVATRWYRAPELMLSKKSYSKSVDMWAVGCILLEFYGRRPLFVGNDQLHQVSEILKVLGSPSKEMLNRYGNLTDVSFKLFAPPRPQYKKIPWSHIYPYACDDVYDLLDGLLCWDSHSRLSCQESLRHPYFSKVSDATKEIAKGAVFDFMFESNYENLADLKEILVDEVKSLKNEQNCIECF